MHVRTNLSIFALQLNCSDQIRAGGVRLRQFGGILSEGIWES